MEVGSMFFFKKQRLHDEKAQKLKESIDTQFSKARASVAKNKKNLEFNGITIEIKRAIGGKHV